jgi:hypothetical protein
MLFIDKTWFYLNFLRISPQKDANLEAHFILDTGWYSAGNRFWKQLWELLKELLFCHLPASGGNGHQLLF